MLVTTAMIGESKRNVPSLSSASATRKLALAESRVGAERAQLAADHRRSGSRPASRRTAPISEVVVVLPCVPATAMPYFMRISSASISARGITGIFSSRARTTSGFEYVTAEEMTSTSTSLVDVRRRRAHRCRCARPGARSRRVVSLSTTSEPDTV